jgi:protein phosphatase
MTVLLAILGWPWTAPLVWLAFALTGVTAGYLGAGPAIYGKRDGRVPLLTRFLFAPTLLGQHLSLRYYRRQCTPWDKALPNVLMGRVLTDSEARDLVECGATVVLDLTAEFSEQAQLRALTYQNLRLLDLTAPTQSELREAVDFISARVADGETVYVHCKVGYSRTATVVGAYLMDCGRCKSLHDVVVRLREARPGIVIRPEAMKALEAFQTMCAQDDSQAVSR